MDVNTANQSTTEEQMMDKEKKTISAVKGVNENGEQRFTEIRPEWRFLF